MKQFHPIRRRLPLALLLVLTLILFLCACEKGSPESETSTEPEIESSATETISAEDTALESFQFSSLTLNFVGAEAFQDSTGADVLRLWFDLSNEGETVGSANDFFSFTAVQSDQTLLWADSDSESVNNLAVRIRPGAISRYCLQYALVSRQPVTVTVEDRDGQRRECRFLPDSLPGAPAEDLPEAAETETSAEPSYSDLPASYDLYGQYTVTATAVEISEDGQELLLHYDFANNTDSAGVTAGDFCRIRAYQNGKELERSDASDSTIQVPVALGESESRSVSFILTDTTPVTLEFSDIWEDTLYLSLVAPGE